MRIREKLFAISVSVASVCLPSLVYGAQLDSTTTDAIDTVIADMVQDLIDLFTDNVGEIFTIGVALLGVLVLYKFVKRVAR